MNRSCLVVAVLLLTISASAQKSSKKAVPTAKPAPATITLALDATDAPRRILHAHLAIPATPGTLTLYYPKWIPGEHGPTGPIQNLTGLIFTGNGNRLNWRRDLLDGWTFHVEVPAGVTTVETTLDFVSPLSSEGIYTAGASATEKLAVISWNTVLLYPEGWTSDELRFQALLRLPAGWKFGTPLKVMSQAEGQIQFAPVSLTTLVDSPVITGQYMRIETIGTNPQHEMDIAADSGAALDAPADFFDHHKQLVVQAKKLFGAQHYREYHFLYSLSDHVAHFGLEHHESNDSRVGERGMVDSTERLLAAGLLSHEYVHSWNGKYRRPADLATPDYQKPMQDDLLWVYEGLTSYLGEILSARSNLRTPEQFRDSVAEMAADLQYRSGRTWRNLQDTADAVPSMQGASGQWQNWRRPVDYYAEDVLNWMAVDVILHQESGGKKSMDDFCQAFHGGASGDPEVRPYTFDDIVNSLNSIVPYDWRKFWTERLTNHGPGAPLDGIEASGWKLVFNETPSPLSTALEYARKTLDSRYSVGLFLNSEGWVRDTVEGSLAAKAGIGPGMRIAAVNGRKFTPRVWRDALHAAKGGSDPIEVLVENTDYFRTFKLDYHDGERFPHLERDASKPDLMSDFIKAK
jgi:predicted metalloprotease with PDZ domain